MKLNLEVLAILDAIEQHGSLSAAAAKLYKTPSALSYMVQKLEGDLAITLLDRSGHKIAFTQAGRMLLEKGREILHAARDLELQSGSFGGAAKLSLAIGVDSAFPFPLLMPLLERFYQQFPHVRLSFTHEVLGGAWEGLVEGRTDMVLGAVSMPPTQAQFACRALGQLEHLFVHASTHPLAATSGKLTSRQVKHHRAVVVSDSAKNQVRRGLFLLSGQETITVHNFDAKLQLLLSGVGCGYLPRHLAQPFIERGELVSREIEGRHVSETAYLGWNSEHGCEPILWWLGELEQLAGLREVYA